MVSDRHANDERIRLQRSDVRDDKCTPSMRALLGFSSWQGISER
jgi:hypothetical protein